MLKRRTLARVLAIALAIAPGSASLEAERLPLRIYNASNGLAHDRVRCLLADSRGFLWLCTADGLSRFDGTRFVNYGREHGLPHPEVQDVVEAGPGVYWIATEAGLARLRASPASSAATMRPLEPYSLGPDEAVNHVYALKMDGAGRMWVGTAGGLFVLEHPLGEPRVHRVAADPVTTPIGQVRALAQGPDGTIWIGTLSGLFRSRPAGGLARDHSLPAAAEIRRLLIDRAGRIWASSGQTLSVAVPATLSPASGAPPVRMSLPRCDGSRLPTAPGDACQTPTIAQLPAQVRSLRQTADGRVFIGTAGGLIEFDGDRFHAYSETHGLPNNVVNTVAEDRAGNIWIGTDAQGAVRLTSTGFVSFTKADGLGHEYVTGISQSGTGRVRVSGGWPVLSEFDGERFLSASLGVPGRVDGARVYDVLETRTGELWVGTPGGLFRFPGAPSIAQLARTRPTAVYSAASGLPADRVAPSFEDSRGDIWMTAYVGEERRAVRWQRATGRFDQFPETDAPLVSLRGPAFAEDAGGAVWLGSRRGLARYRNGRFTGVLLGNATDPALVTALHVDRTGRLWVGTRGEGLYRSDDPTLQPPRFTHYSGEQGLSSETVWSLTDDQAGNLYAGTARGVDRLDPATGRIKRFTVADGLAGSEVITAFRDRDGALWFGTFTGISRLTVSPGTAPAPPTVWIGGLRIRGVAQPLEVLGQPHLAMGELGPDQNQVRIDFFGLSPAPGESLAYQHQLEGTHADWSAPTADRTIDYAQLAPGAYRFLVRAVSPDGHTSVPASVTFVVLPPVWKRAWFLGTVALLAVGAGYGIHRYRVARLFEMERLRTRIASDLHDDVGSSLTQISMLSEIVRSRLPSPAAQIADPLSRIGTLSRESVDTMSDIVWAIDPVRDMPVHLVQRMRRVANEILDSAGLQLQFTTAGDATPRLNADVRRHVFLIFKEILNNIVRHAHASSVNVEVMITSRHLRFTVTDDGRGFDPAAPHEGQGLRSLRRRTSTLDGSLNVSSSPGAGTCVVFTLPVR